MEEKSYPPPYSTAPLGFEQQIPPYPINQGLQQPPFPQYSNQSQPPPLDAYNTPPTAVPVTYVVQPQPTIAAINSTPRVYQPIRRYGFTKRKHIYLGIGIIGGIFLVMVIIAIVIGVVVSRDISESEKRHEEFRNLHFP